MKKKISMFSRIFAVLIVVCLLFVNQPWTYVAAEEAENQHLSQLYVSEVKMFHGLTREDAKKDCESQGYVFCDDNLNDGGGEFYVYLGYKTTTNKDEAITDMTLLDQKRSSFKLKKEDDLLNQYAGAFESHAQKVAILVDKYQEQYRKQNPNAIMINDALNCMETEDKQKFGDYLLNLKDPKAFFRKYIQRGNAMLVQTVIHILTYAVAEYCPNGEDNWTDRLKKSELPYQLAHASSAEHQQYDLLYQDSAAALYAEICRFCENYKEGSALYDQHGESFGYDINVDAQDEEAFEEMLNMPKECKMPEYVDAMNTYKTLAAIPYCDAAETPGENARLLEDETDNSTEDVTAPKVSNMAEYFMQIAEDPKTDTAHLDALYPFVAALNTAQRTVLDITGFTAFIRSSCLNANYVSNRSKCLEEIREQLKMALGDAEMFSIWYGVDTSEWDQIVAQTSYSIQREQAGAAIKKQENGNVHEQYTTWKLVQTFGGFVYQAVTLGNQIAEIIWHKSFSTLVSYLIESLCAKMFEKGLVLTSCLIWKGLSLINTLISTLLLVKTILDIYTLLITLTGHYDEGYFVEYQSIPQILYDVREKKKKDTTESTLIKYKVVPSYSTYDNNLLEQEKKLNLSWYHVFNACYRPYGPLDQLLEVDLVNSSKVQKIVDVMKDTDYHWGLNLIETKNHHNETPVYKYTEFQKCIQNRDKVNDLSGFEDFTNKWVALYTTTDPAAGEPIAVENDKSFYKTSQERMAPEGYKPVALTDGQQAADINDSANDSHIPRYMFIPGESSAVTSGKEIDSSTYITDVVISHNTSNELARDYLLKSDLECIDVNLTPDSGYTYVGYKLGRDEKNAIRDLRVASIADGMSIRYGDALYSCGADAREFTGAHLGLFKTLNECAGSPILKIKVTDELIPLGNEEGWEPACGFNGGQAVDLSANWTNLAQGKYIYFLPKTIYTSEDETGAPAQQYVSGFSYFTTYQAVNVDKPSDPDFIKKCAENHGFTLVGDNHPKELIPADAIAFGYELSGSYTQAPDMEDIRSNKSYADQSYVSKGGMPRMKRNFVDLIGAQMYLGVSYTYNPCRAIYGISGLVTDYTLGKDDISGMSTPAGGLIVSGTVISGMPTLNPGTAFAYNYYKYQVGGKQLNNTCTAVQYNRANLRPDARQKPALASITSAYTAPLTHYLFTLGPSSSRNPYTREDICFRFSQTDTNPEGFVPVCDMRTPTDLTRPINYAFDTTNYGAAYLYLYQKEKAGCRTDGTGSNIVTRRSNIAAVVVGTGQTAAEAIANLYQKAEEIYNNRLAGSYSDANQAPLLSELCEIVPTDLRSHHPWYASGDSIVYCPSNGQKTEGCAYMGYIRTDDNGLTNQGRPVSNVVKYYGSQKLDSISFGTTKCFLAGGPVESDEGNYYLYYTLNKATSKYNAPAKEFMVDENIFRSGCLTGLSYQDSGAQTLPGFETLRMRTDEFRYIHCSYDIKDLPYIESLYIGYGKTMKEAYSDLLTTFGAFEATDVNCNNNANSDTCIVIGYRRTSEEKTAIRDLFLYAGNEPPKEMQVDGYTLKSTRSGRKTITSSAAGTTKYKILYHQNAATGKNEPASLVKGTASRTGLYLYYTTENVCGSSSDKTALPKIRNICFTYGDLTPIIPQSYLNDSSKDAEIAAVLSGSSVAVDGFDTAQYKKIQWEAVLGITEGESYQSDASVGRQMSLNYGVIPEMDSGWHMSDNRVMMYVTRNDPDSASGYTARANVIPPAGSYLFASSQQVGELYQVR